MTQPPTNPTSFSASLVRTARALEERAAQTEIAGLPQDRWEIAGPHEAAQALLLHVATSSVPAAPRLVTGTADDDEAARTVTFLLFCALPLASRLRREGVELDAGDAVLRVAATLLRAVGEERFTRIYLAGRAQLRALLQQPREHPVAHWAETLAGIVIAAVEARDPAGLEPLERLYAIMGDVVSTVEDEPGAT